MVDFRLRFFFKNTSTSRSECEHLCQLELFAWTHIESGDAFEILTSIVIGGGKLGALVTAASTVAGLHFELIPGGLPQLTEEELSGGIGFQALPGPGAFGPEIQHHISDGATAAGTTLQVEACVGGVDVGEQRLVLVEHGLCGAQEWSRELLKNIKVSIAIQPVLHLCRVFWLQ